MIVSPQDRVCAVVQQVAEARSIVRQVNADESLIAIGLTSLDTVKLVLLVESEFDLTLPLTEITPANFRSISTISRMITRLLGERQ